MEKVVRKLQMGRMTLLLMTILTGIYFVLLLFGIQMDSPYSAFLPQFLAVVAHAMMVEYGFSVSVLFVVLLGIALIAIYALAWVKTKTSAKWFMIAFILFFVDTLFLIYWYQNILTQLPVLLTIAIHFIILYYLYTSYQTFAKNPDAPDWSKGKYK